MLHSAATTAVMSVLLLQDILLIQLPTRDGVRVLMHLLVACNLRCSDVHCPPLRLRLILQLLLHYATPAAAATDCSAESVNSLHAGEGCWQTLDRLQHMLTTTAAA